MQKYVEFHLRKLSANNFEFYENIRFKQRDIIEDMKRKVSDDP